MLIASNHPANLAVPFVSYFLQAKRYATLSERLAASSLVDAGRSPLLAALRVGSYVLLKQPNRHMVIIRKTSRSLTKAPKAVLVKCTNCFDMADKLFVSDKGAKGVVCRNCWDALPNGESHHKACSCKWCSVEDSLCF